MNKLAVLSVFGICLTDRCLLSVTEIDTLPCETTQVPNMTLPNKYDATTKIKQQHQQTKGNNSARQTKDTRTKT